MRVGIIGCGRISDLHMLGYRGRDDADVVALCDVDRSLAQAKAVQWELGPVAVYDDHRDLCSSGLVELVEIIVPHHLHYEIAAFAIAAELHVSLQKPLALNLDHADHLVEAAAATSKTVRLYENFLFYPPVVKAVQLIEQGLIGEPLTIRLKSNSGYSPTAWDVPPSARAWRHDPAACGGGPMVFDDGHHKFALAWLMLGQPTEVHAWIGATQVGDWEVDSPSLVSLRYPNGALGSIEAVHSPRLLIQETAHYAQDDRLEVTGTRGVVWVNRGHGQIGSHPPVVSYADGQLTAHECERGWEHSFIGATRNLLDSLAADREPTLAVPEGRDILAAALAAQESAASKTPAGVDGPVGRSPRRIRQTLIGAPEVRESTMRIEEA